MVRKNAPLSGMAGGSAPLPETRCAQIYRAPRHGAFRYTALRDMVRINMLRHETQYLKKNTGFGKFRSPFFVAVRQQYAASRSYNVT